MKNVSTVEEPEVKQESGGGAQPKSAEECLTPEEEEVVRRIEKRVDDVKAALEDAEVAAERLMRRGQYAVEDSISEVAHRIKRNPFMFMGIALALGAAIGLIAAPRSASKSKRNAS